jgi:hypothetical protein
MRDGILTSDESCTYNDCGERQEMKRRIVTRVVRNKIYGEHSIELSSKDSTGFSKCMLVIQEFPALRKLGYCEQGANFKLNHDTYFINNVSYYMYQLFYRIV